MKKQLKIVTKVSLILGVCLVNIALIMHESKATAPDKVPDKKIRVPINKKPAFYSQSPQEGLWDALIYYDVKHPEIVYAQALLETGYFKSKGCTRDNNLFGLYNSKKKRYHKFNHWTESVVKYKEWIQYRYKPPNNYYEFLRKIRYAEDPSYIIKLKRIVKKHGKVKQNASSGHYQQVK